jgi:hypothetical protein
MRRLFALTSCAAALLLAGCAYRLGPTGGQSAGSRSITVNPVSNHTLQPGVADVLGQDLRTALQRDGTYKLDTHGAGDLVVDTTITSYTRSGVSFRPNDIVSYQDERLTVTAHVVARDRASGKVLVERDISGFALVRVGADLTSAERQSLPLVTRDLAQNITTVLVDGAW